MATMADEIRDKEERRRLLEEEYNKIPKNINRSLYTYRIIDIIGSIAKQKKGIDRIIAVCHHHHHSHRHHHQYHHHRPLFHFVPHLCGWSRISTMSNVKSIV